jgi:murein DD-endopeptidase MepM/ murein hydrolase activator NlpD
VNRLRSTRFAALLAVPMLLVSQCSPACAPPPAPPAAGTVQGIPVPALGGGTTPYRVPVADVGAAGWATTHHDYPATDIFVRCGAVIVAPVNGVIVESRRVDSWVRSIDDPATRGGRSVTLVGDDGVRYYMAHFQSIDAGIEPGVRVAIGQRLGLMGESGDASACHVHFGVSIPCPSKEWSVRRGIVWPYPYLNDWRAGGQRSPVAELEQWSAAHPDACAIAEADPHAPES